MSDCKEYVLQQILTGKNMLFYSVGHWQICLRAGPKLAAGRAGPQNGLEIAGRAENFRPVHISTMQAAVL